MIKMACEGARMTLAEYDEELVLLFADLMRRRSKPRKVNMGGNIVLLKANR